MKRFVMIAFIVAIGSVSVSAQEGAGGPRRFDPAKMKERELVRLKEADLKLTDEQADSVVTINIEVMQKMRGFKDLSEEERTTKRKEMNDYRNARWAIALKDKELAAKVAEYYEKARANRQGMGEKPQQ